MRRRPVVDESLKETPTVFSVATFIFADDSGGQLHVVANQNHLFGHGLEGHEDTGFCGLTGFVDY